MSVPKGVGTRNRIVESGRYAGNLGVYRKTGLALSIIALMGVAIGCPSAGRECECEREGEYYIEFTLVPDYGALDRLHGRICVPASVSYDDLVLAVYIKVQDSWWTKPYWAYPLTTIQQDCTWQCEIVTGGYDEFATEIAAYLLPAGIDPPSCGACDELPDIPETLAFASVERIASER